MLDRLFRREPYKVPVPVRSIRKDVERENGSVTVKRPKRTRRDTTTREQEVLEYLCEHEGELVNLTEMGDQIGIGYSSAYRYVKLLLKRGSIKRGKRIGYDSYYEVIHRRVNRSHKKTAEVAPLPTKKLGRPYKLENRGMVLSYLRRHQMQYLTLVDISQATGVSPSSVALVIKKLEADGKISRSVAVPRYGTKYRVNDSDIVKPSVSKAAAPVKTTGNGDKFHSLTQNLIIEYLVEGNKNDLLKFSDWIDQRNK